MSKACDVVDIGRGQNGPVGGTFLVTFGLQKLALEGRNVISGATLTQDVARGFRASIFSYLTLALRPRIISDVDLRRRGGVQIMQWSYGPASRADCDQIAFLDRVAKTADHFGPSNEDDGESYLPNEWPNCCMIEDDGSCRTRPPVRTLGSYTN